MFRKEGDTTKKMLNMRTEKEGEAHEEMAGQHKDAMKECKMMEDMAQNRSVWHMESRVSPFLHGGGLYVRRSV